MSEKPDTDSPTIAMRMTAKQLLALTDALAFSLQHSYVVHGESFINDLHQALTTVRKSFRS